MSVPTTVQSKAVPLLISLDNGVTFKSVLCKRASNFNGTTATNTEDTDCGTFSAQGAPSWNVDFEGVLNTTPNSPTEMSASLMFDTWVAGTRIIMKFVTGNGLGNQIGITGGAYISDYSIALQTGSLVAFSFTAQGDGVPTRTP